MIIQSAYPNLRQLPQLKRLDPASYRTALIALRSGFVAMANEVVRRGMQNALSRLLAAKQPAAQPEIKKVRCDAYLGTPANLKRCHKMARFQIVLKSGSEPYQVNRCQSCRDDLRAKAEIGATFDILNEVAQ